MPIFPMVFTIFNLIEFVLSKYEEGEIKTHEKWVFIARFCFLSEHGQFQYDIQYEKAYAPVNLLLYYDSDNQWPAVYKSNKTCKQREAVLSRRLNQIITLTKEDYSSGCEEFLMNQNRTVMVQCHQGRRFHSSRERWWFLAISNCNTTKGIRLKYRFLMTNGEEGDYWHEHFSADEFYILPVLSCYCIVYLLLVLAVIMCAMELKSRQLYHATYKLFALSVYLQVMGMFIQSVAYVRYAVDGVGVSKLRNVGRIFESSSEVTFLLLLLLLAKGYTITRGRLRLGSSVKLTIFMCLYVIMYVTLFIYERLFFDPGEVLYLYESPAGYGLVVLRIVAWWMFIYSTVFTLKHYPEKSSFYYPFNLVGTMWFVAGPAFILAANTLIDKWVRESVVCAVQHFIALAGHILFLILTVPNKANKNFPYHVRTTQIGIMEMTNGTSGNNTIDHFGHHPYAPGGPTFQPSWSRVPTELFTISSPQQWSRISRVSRRLKIEERIDERPFTPENLVIRPEEVLPLSNGSVAPLRQHALSVIDSHDRDVNANNRVQINGSLHTLDSSFTPDILPNHVQTLSSNNLKNSSVVPNGLSSSIFLSNELLSIGQSLGNPQERSTTASDDQNSKLTMAKPNGSINTLFEGDETASSKMILNEATAPISLSNTLDPENEQDGISSPLNQNEDTSVPKIQLGSLPLLNFLQNESSASQTKLEESSEPKAELGKTINESPLKNIPKPEQKKDPASEVNHKKRDSIFDPII